VRKGAVFCLYERGEKQPYERITLAAFPPAWIEAGKAEK
jgi:hypothetical protein